MRLALVSAAILGCGGSSETIDDHHLHGGVETTADAVRVHYVGRGVALTELPEVSDAIGLPVSGTADVLVDVRIPIADGKRDERAATGSITVACTRCALGDGVARLGPPRRARASAFAGEGVVVGPLRFDRLEARVTIEDARVELVHWVAESPDVTLRAALSVELATPLGRSTIHGCVGFAAAPDLAQRDPKTAALLGLTGAARGDDGLDYVEVIGTLGSPRFVPRACPAPPTP